MAIINKTNNKRWRGVEKKKGALIHCWWECKLVQPLRKTVGRLLCDPVTPLPGMKNLTFILKDVCTPMFTAVFIHGGQGMATRVSPDR